MRRERKLAAMRNGPSPLSVHIGMAAAEMSRLAGGHGDFTAQDFEHSFAAMLHGIHKYQNYEGTIERPALERIYHAGQLQLLCMQSHAYEQGQPVVLLVPSMINRSQIFNLTQERSFMQYFAQQGLYPVLLDWGESAQDADQADLDALLTRRMGAALAFLQDHFAQQIHGLGYCMGGTLLVAAAQLFSGHFKSLSFLAAPWDFAAGGRALARRIDFWKPQAAQLMEGKNYLDKDWLQSVFASMDPLQVFRKFSRFAAMEDESVEALLFIAIEDWLNEGVDLPAGIARSCIYDWFTGNAPALGSWHVAGQVVDPSRLDVAALVVASSQDKLVEYDSAAPLARAIKGAQIVQPFCGHIGMMAGRDAVKDVWQPMAAFIASCT